jgi:hypothetical protein
MKRMCIVLVTIMIVFGNAGRDLDDAMDPDVSICSVNPELQAIEEQLDQAKANRDMVRFKELLAEYKKLNPPTPVEDGPQIVVNKSFPVLGNQGPRQPLWASDQIVDSAWSYNGISMDVESNGTVWIVASRKDYNGNYFLSIWASDDGVHWPWAGNISWPNHDYTLPSLKIVEQNDSTYLMITFVSEQLTAPYEIDLWTARCVFGGSWTLHPISVDSGIVETLPSLDEDNIQYPNYTYLYCAFEHGDSVAFTRSVDLGQTWTQQYFLGNPGSSYTYTNPSCAYGWHTEIDSFDVGVVWVYSGGANGPQRLRFCSNYSYGYAGAWLDWQSFSTPSGYNDWRPSFKMTHGTMPSATITFARRNSGNLECLCNWYTYDAGNAWTNDTLYGSASPVSVCLNCLAVDDTPDDFHVFFKHIYDRIRYKEAHYDYLSYPGWSQSIAISDGGNASQSIPPASAVRGDQPCVCWQEVDEPQYLKFDALWAQPGVEEIPGKAANAGSIRLTPNPCHDRVNLSFSSTREGLVTVSLFDVSGRFVKTLTNGTVQPGVHTVQLSTRNLAAGVYFVRADTPDGQVTTTMTVIK